MAQISSGIIFFGGISYICIEIELFNVISRCPFP